MKKYFVSAIMAIALITGSVSIYADNTCSAPCTKQKTACTHRHKADCPNKDCKACTTECKAADCADCKCDKSACRQNAKCQQQKNDCPQKQCNKRPCQNNK